MRPAPPLPAPPGLASCRALVAYDADARGLLVDLKNHGRRAAVAPLAAALVSLAPEVEGLVVTWAPTGAPRRRRRGYDGAELLARAVARRAGLPVRPLLRRVPGPPQEGRRGAARHADPSFGARPCRSPVLVVDDVATTGATLSAAARALRVAGALEVHGLVVARASAPGEE